MVAETAFMGKAVPTGGAAEDTLWKERYLRVRVRMMRNPLEAWSADQMQQAA
jgi:hypothetical protein